ncbi:hypothetical protein [Streptomyces malaysiensis]|uniref:Transposase n=1 Tax=Streptomyces malaysiensis subsp. samsunensis TaxID=459658 RepID=A0A9X2M3Z3_STRMQ|nr:hypothetical protein [Streptomyces samsunensis]MCQ8834922.1 hypothetical protein [Streptomyces samsunensis]
MAECENIRTGRHCAFVLHAYLVFVMKNRHKVFADRHYWRANKLWSGSYFAESVAPLGCLSSARHRAAQSADLKARHERRSTVQTRAHG